MTTKLIIIRGNSGSGKTTAAIKLQHYFAQGKVMRISQDDIRRGILNIKDCKNNPTTDLIQLLVQFGKDKFDYIVIEGILRKDIYQNMFQELSSLFASTIYAYYFDLTFDETLLRHAKSEKSAIFGTNEMKRWWLENDYLAVLL